MMVTEVSVGSVEMERQASTQGHIWEDAAKGCNRGRWQDPVKAPSLHPVEAQPVKRQRSETAASLPSASPGHGDLKGKETKKGSNFRKPL